MAYTWNTGETITAENLNKTGNVVFITAEKNQEETGIELDATVGDVLDLLDNGCIVVIDYLDVYTGDGYTETTHRYQPISNYSLLERTGDGESYSFQINCYDYNFYAYSEISLDALREEPLFYSWD